MASVSITKLYSLLSEKIGKETAEDLVNFIDVKIKDEFEEKSSTLATKEDVSKLETKMAENKVEMIKWMFIFWIGQIAATFGFILLFLKK